MILPKPAITRQRAASGQERRRRGAPWRWALALLGALLLGIGLTLWALEAEGHPGALDPYGGHFDERTGLYHYHRPKLDIGIQKQAYLIWLEYPEKGVIKGTVARIKRPDTIWVRIPYRPAYNELSNLIGPGSRDDKDELIEVGLLYVSPEQSGNQGARYREWFEQKVLGELKQKLVGKEVSVQVEFLPRMRFMRGMVFLGRENVNLWMVLNGLSYYVLTEGDNPNEKLFLQAEQLARQNKVGLYQPSR
jgi:endonuclease YncB( thermonuclease family)